jgi:hypothetical protein
VDLLTLIMGGEAYLQQDLIQVDLLTIVTEKLTFTGIHTGRSADYRHGEVPSTGTHTDRSADYREGDAYLQQALI